MNEGLVLVNLAILGAATFFGLVIAVLAKRKNRTAWLWGLCGSITFLFAGIALACVSILCPRCKEPLTNKQWHEKSCPNCGDLRL